ncbi:MAG: hypothetical protein ACTHMG_16670, partial [Sphingomonas sp.]
VQLRDGDALITRARANIVASFLDDPAATHLIFIDADIGFEPEEVLRLLASGHDMVAGAYPIKKIDWNRVRQAVSANKKDIAAASLDYVLELNDPNNVTVCNGFTRIRYGGTGFLMVRRRVLEQMCENHPELRFELDLSAPGFAKASSNRFALFECMIDPESRMYLSEDFSFCKRWTDMGGEIWGDLQSRLNHVGPTTYRGDLSTQFSLAVAPNDAAAEAALQSVA